MDCVHCSDTFNVSSDLHWQVYCGLTAKFDIERILKIGCCLEILPTRAQQSSYHSHTAAYGSFFLFFCATLYGPIHNAAKCSAATKNHSLVDQPWNFANRPNKKQTQAVALQDFPQSQRCWFPPSLQVRTEPLSRPVVWVLPLVDPTKIFQGEKLVTESFSTCSQIFGLCRLH